MRFDTLKDPALCAAKEETRYAIDGVALVKIGERSYLAATDGRILSLVSAQLDDADTAKGSVAYPRDTFDAARKAAKANKRAEAAIELNGRAVVRDAANFATTEYPALDEKRFPDVVSVVPKGKAEYVVQFNAEYLAMAQRALGAQALRIECHGDDVPARLVPIYLPETGRRGRSKPCATPDGSFAVLMPISADKP